jgi:hypothetical protein
LVKAEVDGLRQRRRPGPGAPSRSPAGQTATPNAPAPSILLPEPAGSRATSRIGDRLPGREEAIQAEPATPFSAVTRAAVGSGDCEDGGTSPPTVYKWLLETRRASA